MKKYIKYVSMSGLLITAVLGCSKAKELINHNTSRLNTEDSVENKNHCQQVSKNECTQQLVNEKMSCLKGLAQELHNCESRFGNNYGEKINEENLKMLDNISKKAVEEKKGVEFGLAKEKTKTEKLLFISKDYKSLLLLAISEQKNVVKNSYPEFVVKVKEVVQEIKSAVEQINNDYDSDRLLAVEVQIYNLSASLALPASQLGVDINNAKNTWSLLNDYYSNIRKDYPDFFGTDTLDAGKLSTISIAELEKILAGVNDMRAQLDNKIKLLKGQLELRSIKLRTLKADAETQRIMAEASAAQATAKFINQTNVITKPLYEIIPAFSNGFLDLEGRYKAVYQIIASGNLCLDTNTAQGAWKHAGCIFLQGEIENANKYLQNSFPLYLMQEVKKIGKYNNGVFIVSAQAIKEDFKNGKVAQALATYSAVVTTLGEE